MHRFKRWHAQQLGTKSRRASGTSTRSSTDAPPAASLLQMLSSEGRRWRAEGGNEGLTSARADAGAARSMRGVAPGTGGDAHSAMRFRVSDQGFFDKLSQAAGAVGSAVRAPGKCARCGWLTRGPYTQVASVVNTVGAPHLPKVCAFQGAPKVRARLRMEWRDATQNHRRGLGQFVPGTVCCNVCPATAFPDVDVDDLPFPERPGMSAGEWVAHMLKMDPKDANSTRAACARVPARNARNARNSRPGALGTVCSPHPAPVMGTTTPCCGICPHVRALHSAARRRHSRQRSTCRSSSLATFPTASWWRRPWPTVTVKSSRPHTLPSPQRCWSCSVRWRRRADLASKLASCTWSGSRPAVSALARACASLHNPAG